MNSNIRESHNMKKIRKFNNIDQSFNKDEYRNLIIKPQKIEKPNIDISALVSNREFESKNELDEARRNRINQPYKGIIKDADFNKIKIEKDLIVHTVCDEDKNEDKFEENLNKFGETIQTHNNEIKDIYSIDKKIQHKKEFDYQHKYKYRTKIEGSDDNELRTDRIEFYKKEQNKLEDSKKKVDDILFNLIDSGILSENLDSINYDKIDAQELENTLKNAFGEEEFAKLMKEIS